ncbi:MAG TPA: acyltransferase [Acidimicrobiales bacterium]|nr:acyltransferase [Acidimicrobiales bacterium]
MSKHFFFREFDLYRVVALVGVVGQHSVLWPVPGGSKVGWSLVMFLHATRNLFFFLAALVAVYSQLAEPRRVVSLWVRRLGTVLVPYLAWTFIYFGYTMATTHAGAAGPTLWHDLYNGYYQLYFLVVLFQVYLVLPGIVWLVRRTRGHHGWVFGVSLAFQLAMMTMSHYFRFHYGDWHAVRAVDITLTTSRLIVGYQLFVIAGALAADHMAEMQRLMARYSSRVIWGVAAVFVVTEGYYAFGLTQGNTPGHASDLYQPVATVWFLAACYGLWAIGWRWANHPRGRHDGRFDRFITWGSDASGGYYLSHVLVLQLIFSGLQKAGLTGHSTWGAASILIFVGTLVGAGILVTILMRTPLRPILTGPNRDRQRAAFPRYPSEVAGTEPLSSTCRAPAARGGVSPVAEAVRAQTD